MSADMFFFLMNNRFSDNNKNFNVLQKRKDFKFYLRN